MWLLTHLRLPLTISIHRTDVDSLFLPDPGLTTDYNNHDLYLPFNFSNLDWYLISASESKMSIFSPSSANFLSPINSTGLPSMPSPSSSIRAMPLVKAIPVALVLSSIVVLCICGNILVILSVFTFRPLRTVQNFFIVSLAFSDMFVAIMVMPFHIVTHLLNRWVFGRIFCQVFVTSDVLLCTSSILNLCAIALDRYWAISDPIQYARQRTLRRVLAMIMLVWVLSAIISIPPIITTMFGSNELQNFNELQQCELSNNKAYVIYSACGSFYIPALIMTIVYAQVFIKTRKRFRERAKAAAKLANATRTNKDCPSTTTTNPLQKVSSKRKHHHHRHHHKKPANGIGADNFSTDDAEETGAPTKTNPLINISSSPNDNHLVQCQNFVLNPTHVSRSINSDDSEMIPMIDEELPSSSPPPPRPTKVENGSLIQQQHAAVQTNVLRNKTKSAADETPTKEGSRKSLFKGKTLAALMNERQKISLTRERRLSRTLGIIISVFLLCWLPFFVVYILSAFVDVARYVKEPLPTLILWLGYMNSACNPLIYTVFNVEFRTAFQRLLFSNCMKSSFNRNYTNKQSRT